MSENQNQSPNNVLGTTGFPTFRTELNAILDVDHGHEIKSYGLCSDEIPSLFDSSNVGEILKYLQV